MTNDQLAAVLAERVLHWRVSPDRFLTGKRGWMPRWRFQPTEKLTDALRLLEYTVPQEYAMGAADSGGFWAKVRVAGAHRRSTRVIPSAGTNVCHRPRDRDRGGFVKALQPNLPEVLRALGLLAERGQVIELRLLDVQGQGQRVPATMSGYFDDFRLLADNAIKYGVIAKGVYVTLNPVNQALLAGLLIHYLGPDHG